MTWEIEALMSEKEIKVLILESGDNKQQQISLPPYYQASELATGSNAIAITTPCDDPSSPEQESPLETAAVETRAIQKWTSEGIEPASTLYQHAGHFRPRRRTSIGTNTVCNSWNTGRSIGQIGGH